MVNTKANRLKLKELIKKGKLFNKHENIMLTYNPSLFFARISLSTKTRPGQRGTGCLRGAKPFFFNDFLPPLPRKDWQETRGLITPLLSPKVEKPFRGIFRSLDFDLRAPFLRGCS